MNIDYTKFDAKFLDITPNMAEQFLSRNTSNRRLRKSWSDALIREIKNGNYQTTHQGIAFTKSGLLVDGQHRLTAIKDSKQTVKMLVTTGLEDSVFQNIDRGMKRSLSDTTHLPKKCAEACRLAAEYTFGSGAISSKDVIDIANTGFEQLHAELMEECSTTAKIFSSAPARVMAIVMVMDGHDKDYVFSVYRNIVLVDIEKMPSIATSLIKKAAQGKMKGGGGVFQRELCATYRKIYDIGYKDSRLKISDADISSAIQYIKDVIKSYIS